MGAFSPSRKERKKHKADIVDSPLLQAVAEDPRQQLKLDYVSLAHKFDPHRRVVVPTYNELERLAAEVRTIRRSVLG